MRRNVDEDHLCQQIEQWLNEFESNPHSASTMISRDFTELQRIQFEKKTSYSTDEGAKTINREKNRYRDILPYDRSRVILTVDEHGADYINASFVEDFWGQQRYIAAQGPIDQSIVDFARMIWQLNITTIICLGQELEGDHKKFLRYWPINETSIVFGPYRFTRDSSNASITSPRIDYQIFPLIIERNDNEKRSILLYHYAQWLDHQIPTDEQSILDLLADVDRHRSITDSSPCLIHCSAGCGRTGTLIAIDLCRRWINDQTLYIPLHLVFHLTCFIRQYRIAVVQTVVQTQFYFVQKAFFRLLTQYQSATRAETNDRSLE